MKIKGVFLAAILTAVLCFSGNLLAYSGGTGEPNNPYQIANVADFNQLSATPADWTNKSFILTADINLISLTFTQSPIAPDTDSSDYWDFQGTQFTGIFDGNGHIISNLTIASTQDYIGLFGYLGGNAQIRNLGVEDVNITGRNYVGGLVGCSTQGTLTACYATGSVTGTDYCAGGLVGYSFISTLTTCYATGSVTGTSSYVGGLVGYNSGGSISNCYSTGAVSGYSYVGGLVGSNSGSLTGCYATGSVTGTNYVGGLVGENWGSLLTSCYATGSVSGTGSYVGGLVGYNWYGTLTDCFWDIQTSGQTVGVGDGTSTGVTGKSTEEMKTLSTFTSAGWDFLNIWDMEQVQTYPFLRTTLAADLNKDHEVNFLDFAIFAGQWLEGI